MITLESLQNVGYEFIYLFAELLLLFMGISFLVALLQVYISRDRIRRILTRKRKWLNSVFGALLGSLTPFCSCSTIPILVGLIRSGAPFSGAMSFLLSSPILNPAIIALFLTFFGLKATLIYASFTLSFAVIMGLVLDKLGYAKEIKDVSVAGCCGEAISFETLEGTFWQKNLLAIKHAVKQSQGLFKNVFPYLLLGAALGAFIHEYIPEDLLRNFVGANNLWAVPVAAVVGIPMYIRVETMIPVASILIAKGVGYGTMIALIIGGAGASLPEVSLLSSIFTKKMVITFVLCIFSVATITGYIFNILM
ncbi:permease [Selenomonadales bacterium OttesenSCG-928-I06]|nr:permease [Selenomonadales bacterium OttesenSCG-928-I06]